MTALEYLEKLRDTRGKTKEEKMGGGGLVYVLDEVERAFSTGMLEEILILHNEGYPLRDIADALNRDGDQIFLALLHLARQGRTTRKVNLKHEKARQIKVIKRKKGKETVLEIDGDRYVYEPKDKWR